MLKCLWTKLLWFCLTLPVLKSAELSPDESEPNVRSMCGYESCPKTIPHMLNVHIIPHTHNDVGWLWTFDEYYSCQGFGKKFGVQCILDAVVKELLKDTNKRFIYVESAFFFKWWKKQTRWLQKKVKILVDEGRLEFIGGAWSMNDEATTLYQSTIDQFAWGLRQINDTFGECARPRIGWQIDTFGHSREMASMFAQMGYDGLFFGRLDYQDKDERFMTKRAEMIWRASANLDEAAHLFTGALYNLYDPPPGFCFDIHCDDEPIIDGKHSPNNVNKRVNEFFAYVQHQSKNYRTKNIPITMGGDYTYRKAADTFTNLDKLIRYSNARQARGSKINLLYSTPSCYLKALHDAGMSWPTNDDDFFPYGSEPHAYWTGYFTSRPTLKRHERVGNHFLQVCKQLTALYSERYPELLPHLNLMREAMGILQHHDAITGTSKQRVANDYVQILSAGMRACQANSRSVLNYLTARNEPSAKRRKTLEFKTCSLLNISTCDVSEKSDKFVLTLYNPLAHQTTDYVRLPVMDVNYLVQDPKDVVLDIQFVPVAKPLQKLSSRSSSAKFELIFLATEIPAFGYKSFFIRKNNRHHMKPVPDQDNRSSLTSIGNRYIKLTFDTKGFLSAATADGITRIVNQKFLYYESAVDINRQFPDRSSSVYIFRPLTNTVRSITKATEITVYRGDLVEEVHQKFNNWISQVVRIYKQRRYAEFEWLVGPIPLDDGKGKEIITRFNSDIKSEGIFYTDSNGREMIKRLRNHRDTWNVKLLEQTAGNYYPITTKIALEDEHARMAILTDRAQGGSSMADGSLELMVHRRLLHDNGNIDEPLNEMAYGKGLVARGTHFFILGSSKLDQSPTVQSLERFTQLETTLAPWKFLSDTQLSYDQWKQQFTNIFTGISVNLPQNIHLLTFEPWHEGEILVRLEHILERDEDPEYSKPVQLNIKDVFEGFKVKNLRETTLDGNAWLDENRRMQFVPDPERNQYNLSHLTESSHQELNRLRSEKLKKLKFSVDELPLEKRDGSKFVIELSAMQIRTFLLYLE